jgi:hypothetical protein
VAGSEQLLVRGAALWVRHEWVRVHHGEEGLKALLSELTPAGRNLIHAPIDKQAWYSFPLFLDISIAIDRHFGKGDHELMKEVGRWGASKNIPALFKMFIRFGSVDWVLGKAEKLWSEHYNAGRLEAHRELGQKRAFGALHDFPRPHLSHCNAVLGFAIGAIELSGEKNVRGHTQSCRALGQERCVARLVWGDEPD